MNRVGKALLLSTGVGLIGYGLYKAAQYKNNRECTPAEKKAQEVMNRMYLTNPLLNPLGAGWHLFRFDSKAGDCPFDSPMVKYLTDKSSSKDCSSIEKIPPHLTREERIEYFPKRGGTGFRMDQKV